MPPPELPPPLLPPPVPVLEVLGAVLVEIFRVAFAVG